MTHIEKIVLVPYKAKSMYNLVNDIESYPDFLPWCGGARVVQRGAKEMVAEIDIKFKGVSQSFSTRNQISAPTQDTVGEINMELVSGPFKNLSGVWNFKGIDDLGCRVMFSLSYEFSNTLLEKILGPVFNSITSTFVDSFVTRAQKVCNE
ncbi:MAG: type II toxin-antitoxin system RatA family toxin [Burkholderiales bacterium]|jgi:ribosome-associated toxin RatA of RatAB toxin-antitoxin module